MKIVASGLAVLSLLALIRPSQGRCSQDARCGSSFGTFPLYHMRKNNKVVCGTAWWLRLLGFRCYTPTLAPTPCTGKCFYKFTAGELNMNPPLEHRIIIAQELNGSLDGTFVERKDPILSSEECEALIKHTDAELERTINEGIMMQRGTNITEDFIADLSPSKLQTLIRVKSIHTMYNMFKEFNPDFPVSKIYVRRSSLVGDKHIRYHVDGATLVLHVWWNKGEINGGNIFYLRQNGTTKIETTMGGAIVHGDGIVHGISSFNGTRYTLLLIGDGVDSKDVLRYRKENNRFHTEL